MTSSLTRRAALAGLLAATATPARAQNRPPRFETLQRQFTLVSPVRTLPSLRVQALEGKPLDLAALAGNVTLVNFWATWCPACVNELPILERLHFGNHGVRVVAISVDREGGRDRVARYLKKLNVRKLPVYLDPGGAVAYADRDNARGAPFALYGMPISYVLDRAGRVSGYLAGEADWTSPEALNLLRYYAAS
jgi:thiol-disulfide isomerase/thioredoxin